MKYKTDVKDKKKRKTMSNLTKGAFGKSKISKLMCDMRVLPRSKRKAK